MSSTTFIETDRPGTSTSYAPAPASRTATPAGLAGSRLAKFMELRGRRIVEGCGALWYSVPGGFLMSLPYQTMLDPDPAELRQLTWKTRMRGVRFPSVSWQGLESGLYVLRGASYGLASLHIKHRPRVRRGLQCFEIRPARRYELLEQGLELNLGTMSRQGRYDPEFGDPQQWAKLVEAGFAVPEISFPAAFCGSRLAAYMVTCREDGWLHILHQMSRLEDLSNFPNHSLTYSVTRQAVEDSSLEAVCYGCKPLICADGLHEYKLRFGYELLPQRSVIQLHPLLNALLGHSAGRAAVTMLRRLRPHNQRLETIETVLNGVRASRAGDL